MTPPPSILQDHGAQTIQFVTNGQTSSFAINDLLVWPLVTNWMVCAPWSCR